MPPVFGLPDCTPARVSGATASLPVQDDAERGTCDPGQAKYQKYSFSASWICRGEFAWSPAVWLRTPKVCDCRLSDPSPKRVRLNALKNSPRRSMRTLSVIGNDFATEMFSL